MNLYKITNVKNFMSHLLVHNTFDDFLISEAVICTFNTFSIDGKINKDFFDSDEYENLTKYAKWSMEKPICFNMIKGAKTPSFMKYVFLLDETIVDEIIKENMLSLSASDIEGLFVNIKFDKNELTLTTGTSLKIFSLDKSIDFAFDNYIKNFLKSNNIDFEQM